MPRPPLTNVTLNPSVDSGSFVYSPTPVRAYTRGSEFYFEDEPGQIEVKKHRSPSKLAKKDRQKEKGGVVAGISRRTSFTSVKSWTEEFGNGVQRLKNRSREKKSKNGEVSRGKRIFGRVLGNWSKEDEAGNPPSDSDGSYLSDRSSFESSTGTDSEGESICYGRHSVDVQRRRSVADNERTPRANYPNRNDAKTPDKDFTAWRSSTPSTPRAGRPSIESSRAHSVFQNKSSRLDIKRGRPPTLRLGLDITCTVSCADVRGGQEAWCAINFIGEIDNGDWNLESCDTGIDLVLVLDISAFTSPDSFERMREKTLLLLRNLRAETDNVAIVTFSSRQRRHRSSSISACQTLHFLSPCTPTIIRHLCSVVEGMRPIFSPKSIVREPDYAEAVQRAVRLFPKNNKLGLNTRHTLLMTARQPAFDLPPTASAEEGEIPLDDRIQLHIISTSPILFPETKIPPQPLIPGFIVPEHVPILSLLPYFRVDSYFTPLSQLTLTLSPPSPTHGLQSLSFLSPFESHTLLTHLKIPAASNSSTSQRNVSGSSSSSDSYSTLERHLEATLGQLLTPVLDVSAYYTPHASSRIRAAVRRTLRIRRFFSGSEVGVWAEVDRQDYYSEDARKVYRALAIAMAERGEDYGNEDDIKNEVAHLSTIRGSTLARSTPSTSSASSVLDREQDQGINKLGSEFSLKDDGKDEAARIWTDIRRSRGSWRTSGNTASPKKDSETEKECATLMTVSGETDMRWEKFAPWGV